MLCQRGGAHEAGRKHDQDNGPEPARAIFHITSCLVYKPGEGGWKVLTAARGIWLGIGPMGSE